MWPSRVDNVGDGRLRAGIDATLDPSDFCRDPTCSSSALNVTLIALVDLTGYR
jgi:hypothetical protein